MKKYKTIICMIFMIILSVFTISACTQGNDNTGDDNNNNQTEVTIQLSEAKSMVVDSLESSTTRLQSNKILSNNDNIGNRNLFTKLVNANMTMSLTSGEQILSGVVQKTGTSWTKYVLQENDIKYGYFDGTTAYYQNGTTYSTLTYDESYFGLMLESCDCVFVDLLFIEDAWLSIYNNTVTKTTKDYGYLLTLNINMSSYVDFVMAESSKKNLGAEGFFGEGDHLRRNKDEGSAGLLVKFDKFFNIIGVELTVSSLGSDGENLSFYDTKIIVDKYNNEITQPEWFDINNYI